MPSFLPLAAQTMYAELVDLCAIDEFDAAFPPNGSFVAVTVKARRYWYYQSGAKGSASHQRRKYVGPDNEHNAKLVARHGAIKSSYRQRRAIIAALRQFGLPVPPDETGKILRGLASKGAFRLRACVVGTVAYQAYAGLLGVKLPSPTMQTGDLDLAQSRANSVAIAEDEHIPAILDILQGIDPSFRPIPTIRHPNIAASYINGTNYRVEMLTDNRGPDRDVPIPLPALGTHAQPMRYLDCLLLDSIPAVVLADGGILVNVPQPERYAVHKLILSQVRREASVKRLKDVDQASALFDALAERRSSDLAASWSEAYERGPRWRKPLKDSLVDLDPAGRDRLLFALGATRQIVPNLDIEFRDAPPRYDFSREAVLFSCRTRSGEEDCAISRAALDDWYDADAKGQEGRLDAFRRHRAEIEAMARDIYLNEPVPADGSVMIRTLDVPRLRTRLKLRARRRSQ